MNACAYESDLVVLTADKNMKFAMEGLLSRPQALAIRPLSAVFYIHPESDPGCLLHADDFLRPFVRRFSHAIVMFDREGCGKDQITREVLEQQVTSALSRSGWENRAASLSIQSWKTGFSVILLKWMWPWVGVDTIHHFAYGLRKKITLQPGRSSRSAPRKPWRPRFVTCACHDPLLSMGAWPSTLVSDVARTMRFKS